MFNKVVLVGNLTRDIEMRYAPSGSAIASCAIAVTRRFNSPNGEKKEETCFIDISFFGRSAEIANQYLSKGSKLLVEGRLRFEQWTDQNGQNRSKHSVYVESMEMLGSAVHNNEYGANSNSQRNYQNTGQSYDPYAKRATTNQSQVQMHQQEEKLREIDIDNFDSDDKNEELPF